METEEGIRYPGGEATDAVAGNWTGSSAEQ